MKILDIKFLTICNSVIILLEFWMLQVLFSGCISGISAKIGIDIPAIPNYESLIKVNTQISRKMITEGIVNWQNSPPILTCTKKWNSRMNILTWNSHLFIGLLHRFLHAFFLTWNSTHKIYLLAVTFHHDILKTRGLAKDSVIINVNPQRTSSKVESKSCQWPCSTLLLLQSLFFLGNCGMCFPWLHYLSVLIYEVVRPLILSNSGG